MATTGRSSPSAIRLISTSLNTNIQAVPVPEGHILELDRRFSRHASNPGTLLSLQALQQAITHRL
jgi:hypothetical protein